MSIVPLYQDLITDYFERNNEIAQTLHKKDIDVEFGQAYTMIGNNGLGSFMDTYELLQKPVYQTMLKELN